MFSLCQSSSCGYNYLRVGGRDGCLYLLDTTGDRYDEITVSCMISPFATGLTIVSLRDFNPILSAFTLQFL